MAKRKKKSFPTLLTGLQNKTRLIKFERLHVCWREQSNEPFKRPTGGIKAAIWPKRHHSPESLPLYSTAEINSHNSSGAWFLLWKRQPFPITPVWIIQHSEFYQRLSEMSAGWKYPWLPWEDVVSTPHGGVRGLHTHSQHTHVGQNATAFSVPELHCLQDIEAQETQHTCSERKWSHIFFVAIVKCDFLRR